MGLPFWRVCLVEPCQSSWPLLLISLMCRPARIAPSVYCLLRWVLALVLPRQIYGFLISCLCSLTGYTLNVIFCVTYVKESVKPSSEPVRFFSVGHIRETIQIFTVDKGSNRRWKLIVLLFMVILPSTVDIGSSDVKTFFLLDSPLCFTSVLLGYYESATTAVKAIGAVILMKLLHSCFKDTGLIILGCLAGIAAQLFLAFSHDLFMVFMGKCSHFNTLRPRQNGRHFADDTFKSIFMNENVWI